MYYSREMKKLKKIYEDYAIQSPLMNYKLFSLQAKTGENQ